MNENEDLELQALQRQLDDAFQTTRPRSSFEDELWAAMQERRPWWQRARGTLAGVVAGIRAAPRVPATAVALVLIAAIGVGIVSLSKFHLGGGTASSATSAQAPNGARYSGANGALNPLPAPKLADNSFPLPAGSQAESPPQYAGPSKVVWAGSLQVGITRAPVFVDTYLINAGDMFAASLGAVPQQAGRYAGDGFTLTITGNSFQLTPDPTRLPPAKATPAETAHAFLSAHGIVPASPSMVVVEQKGTTTRVRYLRQFLVPGYGFANAIDSAGQRTGIEVDLVNGQPTLVAGPLPLSMTSMGDYPIITADQAVEAALAPSQRSAPVIQQVPTIRLTSAELVYALAGVGNMYYYEPAFLFSGTFSLNGVTYMKRVLVPAVVPSQLSS
ncbi:MAG TPA: hypothetical protein VLR46_08925 [Candidatus Dormibacteraeota bacterium]|nr:hypothetical protein [Candidatus Dormibacteraeota bacterium]